MAEERAAERKEKRAERAEKIYLAEEEQEKKILQQKADAAKKEEERFQMVEKEYETAAELAREAEAELRYVFGLHHVASCFETELGNSDRPCLAFVLCTDRLAKKLLP